MICPQCEKAAFSFSGERKYEVEVPQLCNPANPKWILVHTFGEYTCPNCGSEFMSREVFKFKNEGLSDFRNLDTIFE